MAQADQHALSDGEKAVGKWGPTGQLDPSKPHNLKHFELKLLDPGAKGLS